METNKVQAAAAATILDRGVKYQIGEGDVTIRPLRFGTVLVITQRVAEAGLTIEQIDSYDRIQLFAEFGELLLFCVAAAELNDREKCADDNLIAERAGFYRDSLTVFQVVELFAHVLNLSGIQSFESTIRALLKMKELNLSPKERGS